ncbi:MAG: protein kinase, partial [Acidobacteriota bacterium]
MSIFGEPPATVGPYRIEERLGGGGMGEVFRGFDERLGRAVALKQIRALDTRDSEEIRERFRREARAIARLDHPAIVHVHDWVETDDGDWLVMELVEGNTLREALDQDGPFDPDRAIRVAIAIAGALATAHEAGILHRDLKLENVMLTPDGGVKLLDFGLAKRVGPERGAEPSLTADGKILGTVSAMSPEQATGDPLDARSDLFALGSLIYRLTSGRSPFSEASPLATLRAIVADRHRPLRTVAPAVPAALSRLVDQLLQKDPFQRPRDAHVTLGLLRELATASAAHARTPRLGPAQQRERRPVTVVAVGTATGEETADPEELLDRVPWIDAMVSAAAERWGGRLEGRVGQHWVVCFGVPIAREDDARRAVQSALELLDQAEESGHSLAAGVHSGTAVVTVADKREELALGPTFDVAGELQARAPARGALVSDATRAMVSRFFRWADAEALRVGGKSRNVFRVKAADEAGDLLDLSTPLIGRSRELDHLLEAWRSALGGSGRVVRLTGEPGVGKSRLLGHLRLQLAEEADPDWIQLHGSTIGRSSPFQPVIQLLRQTLGLRPDDDASRGVEALDAYITEHDLPVEDIAPHLALLLGLGSASHSVTANLDPGVRKRRLQEAIATLWLEQAEKRPMVLVVEDLQWMDPSTIELLTLLVEQAPAVPLLLVATHRLDHRPPWDGHGYVSEIRLERLSPEAVERLATEIAGAPLPETVVEQITDKADGVPLFVEELTRAVLESGQLVERDGRFTLGQKVGHLV